MIVPVILSGGSGTRLWPLSRELAPKQLLRLVTDRSLLQETLLRTAGLADRVRSPIVVCNENHRFLVAEQLREIGVDADAIVLEPAARNTAPAVAAAALIALRQAPPNADPVLLVLPADHLILDNEAFVSAVGAAAAAAAEGLLVTFGVPPDRPETGYGYIRGGAEQGGWAVLERFVEKPDPDTAAGYVASGNYLWNSGMFMFSAQTYLEELARHAPKMLAACREAVAAARRGPDFTRLGESFRDCPADSIDYAVMEKTERAAVVPLDAGWSDIGSWSALHDVLEKGADGNVLRGDVVTEGCRDSYIFSSGRLVTAVGLEGCVVVETPDAVLVMTKSQAQRIKNIVDKLKAGERAEIRAADEAVEARLRARGRS
jgi:mannose-1-phosphate guanylyltransferase/mannose-6-phosphate isomerase